MIITGTRSLALDKSDSSGITLHRRQCALDAPHTCMGLSGSTSRGALR